MPNNSDELIIILRRGVEVGKVDSLVQAMRNAHEIATQTLSYPLITDLQLLTYPYWSDDDDEEEHVSAPKSGIRIAFKSGDKT